MRLRQNLPLKVISLAASIMLYFFVQAERNPTVPRLFLAPIVRENIPPEVEIETDQRHVDVSVTGPRAIMERLKDGDVRAIADLHKVETSEQKSLLVPLAYRVTGLSPEMMRELTFEPANPNVRMRVYPQTTTYRRVELLYSKDPPAGFNYGAAELRPPKVKITGRSDRVKLVDRLLVNATPNELGGIEGDFPVIARDRDNNTVDGITLNPETVRVVVPLTEKPQAKTVPVSPSVPELPLPPYMIANITVSPKQVKIVGRPERLNQIATITTEDIPVRNLNQTQEIEANLIRPPDMNVLDLSGRPITRVLVRIEIRKSPTTPGLNPSLPVGDPSGAAAPPKDLKP